jgi:hypothetical protein
VAQALAFGLVMGTSDLLRSTVIRIRHRVLRSIIGGILFYQFVIVVVFCFERSLRIGADYPAIVLHYSLLAVVLRIVVVLLTNIALTITVALQHCATL